VVRASRCCAKKKTKNEKRRCHEKKMNNDGHELLQLAILAIPIATVTWTITHEEIARDARDWCKGKSQTCGRWYQRKFFYLFTCEYCFSHYVSAFFLTLAGFRLLLPGWRGFFLAWLAAVWLANLYMSLFGRLRLDIHHERLQIQEKENHSPKKTA
jgi:hypothetical protein